MTETRAQRFARLYDEGWTLREIGEAEGVSRQRVHQILVASRHPVDRRARGTASLVASRQHAHEAERDRNRQAILDLYRELGLIGAVLRHRPPGVTQRMVREVLHEAISRLPEHERRKRTGTTVYSNEDLLAALRAAGNGEGLTMREYKARRNGGPSVALIVQRFGRWSYALRDAGLRTVGRSASLRHASRVDRISEEEALRAALDAAEANGGRLPSRATYEVWARMYDAPGATTIAQRIGGGKWTGVVAAVNVARDERSKA